MKFSCATGELPSLANAWRGQLLAKTAAFPAVSRQKQLRNCFTNNTHFSSTAVLSTVAERAQGGAHALRSVWAESLLRWSNANLTLIDS